VGARLTELLRKRLYELYAAYAAGRIDEVLRDYDDNVTMTSYAPVDIFPYLGRKQGKTAVAATMHAAHAAFEYLSYQPVFMVTEQEDAAVIVLARLRQRATGRIIQLFIADFIRFDKGRIVELRQFMDSFDAVQQVLGREIFISKTPD
jgi:ketosteroid isomerase-like protein